MEDRSGSVHLHGKLGPGEDKVQFGHELLVDGQLFGTELFEQLTPLTHVANEIGRCILSEEEIADDGGW